nr:hypothetical protein [Candidatus Sigynarchaeota archaeon]
MEDFRRLVEQSKLEVKEYAVWHVPLETPASLSELPMRVGHGIWSGVLLDDEVQVQFGSYAVPSTALLVTALDPSAVHDGQITLVGQDFPRIPERVVPFALVVIVWGADLTSDRIAELHRALQVTDQIEGFMQRSILRENRYTLSKKLYEKGVTFQHLGRAFLHLYRTQFATILRSVEVVFLTASLTTILALKEITQANRHNMDLRLRAKLAQYAKRRDDCEFDWECNACDYQHICDELREMIRLREDLFHD